MQPWNYDVLCNAPKVFLQTVNEKGFPTCLTCLGNRPGRMFDL